MDNTLETHNTLSLSVNDTSTWYAPPGEQTVQVGLQTTVPSEVSSLVQSLRDVNALLWHIVPPLLLTFGTFGNAMTVLVMRGMLASESTACLAFFFTALAVSDQLQLFTSLTFYWIQMAFSWPQHLFRFNLLCSIPKFVWNVTGITSAWFLVSKTYQRVTSVVSPHRVGVLCTLKRGRVIVSVITLVSCAFNIHFLFTWVYYPEFHNCHFRAQYEYLIGYFEYQDMFCSSVVPFVLLGFGNSILVWHVIKAMKVSQQMRVPTTVGQQKTSEVSSSKVYSMSVTLIITSVAYFLLTIPDSIFDVYLEMSHIDISGNPYYDAVVDLIQMFCWTCLMGSVSSNFYLYLLTGGKFREEAKRCLLCKGKALVNIGRTTNSGIVS